MPFCICLVNKWLFHVSNILAVGDLKNINCTNIDGDRPDVSNDG